MKRKPPEVTHTLYALLRSINNHIKHNRSLALKDIGYTGTDLQQMRRILRKPRSDIGGTHKKHT